MGCGWMLSAPGARMEPIALKDAGEGVEHFELA